MSLKKLDQKLSYLFIAMESIRNAYRDDPALPIEAKDAMLKLSWCVNDINKKKQDELLTECGILAREKQDETTN